MELLTETASNWVAASQKNWLLLFLAVRWERIYALSRAVELHTSRADDVVVRVNAGHARRAALAGGVRRRTGSSCGGSGLRGGRWRARPGGRGRGRLDGLQRAGEKGLHHFIDYVHLCTRFEGEVRSSEAPPVVTAIRVPEKHIGLNLGIKHHGTLRVGPGIQLRVLDEVLPDVGDALLAAVEGDVKVAGARCRPEALSWDVNVRVLGHAIAGGTGTVAGLVHAEQVAVRPYQCGSKVCSVTHSRCFLVSGRRLGRHPRKGSLQVSRCPI